MQKFMAAVFFIGFSASLNGMNKDEFYNFFYRPVTPDQQKQLASNNKNTANATPSQEEIRSGCFSIPISALKALEVSARELLKNSK